MLYEVITHHLQQLGVVGFQVGEQAQLFQHVGGQVLSLVDEQHGAPPGGQVLLV